MQKEGGDDLVGKVIGWTLLGALFLVVLIMLLPISLQIEYTAQKLVVRVRVFFVRLQIFPLKEKTDEQKEIQELKKQQKKDKKKAKDEKKKQKEAAKAEKNKTEKPAEDEEKKPKKKKTLEEWILLGQQVVGSGVKGGKFIFKHIHLKDVEIVLPVYDEDAAQTAIKYGKAQGVLAGAYALLQNFTHITYKRLAVIPDFLNQYKEETSFSCKIEASPIIILIGAIIAVKQYFAYKKQQKENYRLAAKEIVLKRRAAAAQRNQQRSENNGQAQKTHSEQGRKDNIQSENKQ